MRISAKKGVVCERKDVFCSKPISNEPKNKKITKRRRHRMRRFLAVALALLMLLPFCRIANDNVVKAETYVPSRTINLVYDDSGSMIRVGSTYVDTWCQAKYAMEVFAGMLGENETLNIYYMSDYVKETTAPPKLTLTGSKDATVTEANVKKIHDLVTDASDTPFNSVKKAYGEEYPTLREQGITLYIGNTESVWVNGGMLYRLTPQNVILTKKQIKNIATSL